MKILHNIKELEQYRKDLRKRMTHAETLLWSRLRGRQIGYKFRRQHSIGHFIVDFYCTECDVAVEIDGLTHNDIEIFNRDLAKEKFLKEKGIKVLRFNDKEVIKKINDVLGGIWAVCDSISKRI